MRIGIAGCTGRMGSLLVEEICAASSFCVLSGGTARDAADTPLSFPRFGSAEDLFASSDVVIDFTVPEASLHHARIAARTGKPLVIGTTGFSETEREEIVAYSRNAPVLLTPNASLGVNVMLDMVRKAAATLGPDFAVEILEAHHDQKRDAPSGTALALGRAAAQGRGLDLAAHAVHSRHGRGNLRKSDEIGFSVIRGGDIVGEHTVYFIGRGERIEITHRAVDRRIFAKGALQAAKWLAQQQPGFYTMADFLNCANGTA